MATKQQFTALFQNIESMEDNKKAISADVKAAFEVFAASNDVNVKSLKKAFKAYTEYNKNKDEFLLVDTESDDITQKLIPEYSEAA